MKPAAMKIDLLATAALLGASICWGLVPLFLKYLTAYVDGWTANGYRYPIAAILYVPWLFYFRRKGLLGAELARRAAIPALINLCGQVLWGWIPYYIGPGLMAFLIRLSVIWSTLGSFALFQDERNLLTSKRFWTGMLLSIGGFVLMVKMGEQEVRGDLLVGVVLTVSCSLFWGMYAVSVRYFMRDTDPRLSFSLISPVTATGTLIIMFMFGDPGRLFSLPFVALANLVISAILGIGTAHVLYYVAIQRIGVALSSGANFLSSFVTAALSAVIFQEVLTRRQWGAGVLLVLGAFLLVWAQQRVKEAQARALTQSSALRPVRVWS